MNGRGNEQERRNRKGDKRNKSEETRFREVLTIEARIGRMNARKQDGLSENRNTGGPQMSKRGNNQARECRHAPTSADEQRLSFSPIAPSRSDHSALTTQPSAITNPVQDLTHHLSFNTSLIITPFDS